MSRVLRISVVVSVLVALLSVSAFADTHTLKLKDGRILKGEFINATNGSVFFRVVGGTEATRFDIADILAIVFSSASIQPIMKSDEPTVVPAGTLIRVKLTEELSSSSGNAGKKFFAELAADLKVDGETLVAKGKRVIGRYRKVMRPKRSVDKASLEIVLISMPVGGRDVPIITDYCGATNDGKGNALVLGTARLIGMAAADLRDGKHVTLPIGTSIEFRLTQPMTIRN